MNGMLMSVDVEAIAAVVAGILIGVSITWIAVWIINKFKSRPAAGRREKGSGKHYQGGADRGGRGSNQTKRGIHSRSQ
jgi:hypothetical protein